MVGHPHTPWWDTLTEDHQEAVAQRVELLAAKGPALRRPAVGEIKARRDLYREHLATLTAEGGL